MGEHDLQTTPHCSGIHMKCPFEDRSLTPHTIGGNIKQRGSGQR